MRWLVIHLLILFSNTLLSQSLNLCGTDLMMQKNIKKHYSEYSKNKAFLDTPLNTRPNTTTKIVPVVFHIIHDGHFIGTEENISAEQVEDAIRIMNEDFNLLND